LAQISLTAARSAARDETTLSCSQKVVQLLYRAETPLAREVYATLLERLCGISVKVGKEVTAWLVYAEDDVSHPVFSPFLGQIS
jgi:CCR4-NOT transcription complex subunit 1